MRRLLSLNFLLAFVVSATLFLSTPAQRLNTSNTRTDAALKLALPVKDGSVRFAVIGDTGSGTPKQREVGDMMVRYRALFPFEFVLMLGDNLYGGETPLDFERKFTQPYKEL